MGTSDPASQLVAARTALKLLVAAGYVSAEKANDAMSIAHCFSKGPLPPAPAEAQAQGGGEVWQHPDALPPVEPGQYGWFWVAVRRAHNNRVYSFPATYLNAMVLTDENCDQEESRGNRYHHGPVDEDDGTFEATGWHDAKEHYEYSAVYQPLLESDKDELIAWRAVADYGDTAPPSAPVGVEGLVALRIAHKHLDMGSMRVSHCKDAAAIEAALAQQPAAVDGAMVELHTNAALAHLSNALDDLDSSPDHRPVALIREAMDRLRELRIAAQPAGEEVPPC